MKTLGLTGRGIPSLALSKIKKAFYVIILNPELPNITWYFVGSKSRFKKKSDLYMDNDFGSDPDKD